jgi:hypothetical protein
MINVNNRVIIVIIVGLIIVVTAINTYVLEIIEIGANYWQINIIILYHNFSHPNQRCS